MYWRMAAYEARTAVASPTRRRAESRGSADPNHSFSTAKADACTPTLTVSVGRQAQVVLGVEKGFDGVDLVRRHVQAGRGLVRAVHRGRGRAGAVAVLRRAAAEADVVAGAGHEVGVQAGADVADAGAVEGVRRARLLARPVVAVLLVAHLHVEGVAAVERRGVDEKPVRELAVPAQRARHVAPVEPAARARVAAVLDVEVEAVLAGVEARVDAVARVQDGVGLGVHVVEVVAHVLVVGQKRLGEQVHVRPPAGDEKRRAVFQDRPLDREPRRHDADGALRPPPRAYSPPSCAGRSPTTGARRSAPESRP